MYSMHGSSLEMAMPLSAKYLSAASSTTSRRASFGTALIFSTTCLQINNKTTHIHVYSHTFRYSEIPFTIFNLQVHFKMVLRSQATYLLRYFGHGKLVDIDNTLQRISVIQTVTHTRTIHIQIPVCSTFNAAAAVSHSVTEARIMVWPVWTTLTSIQFVEESSNSSH